MTSPRNPSRVVLPDRSAELPPDLPAGTKVRLVASRRAVGTVVRAEQDRGGLYVVVRMEANGSVRCLPPDLLRPVVPPTRRRRATPQPAERSTA